MGFDMLEQARTAHGLVVRHLSEAGQHALDDLVQRGLAYPCACSRKDIEEALRALGREKPRHGELVYPGTCRDGPAKSGPTSLRFRVRERSIHFDDLYLGRQHFDLARCGDVVVQRRDGIASYQLAVVVDDAFQGVTRVVRGADLLGSTPWQMDILEALAQPRPIYGHLPLLTEPDGAKLSKSRRSLPLDLTAIPEVLVSTLTHLSQAPPPDLAHSSIKDVWNWAVAHWRPQALAGRNEIRLSVPGDRKAESKSENCGVQEGVLR